MKTNVTPADFRTAIYPIFGLSLLVLLAPFCLGGSAAFADFIVACAIPIAVGCSVMILIIECVGIRLRAGLQHFGAGILFAFLLYLSGVVSVSAAALLVGGGFNLLGWIYLVFVFGTCGVLPASIFGLIGTAMVRLVATMSPPEVPPRTRPTAIPHFKR
ncbi:hypothetical protein OKA04_22175 [Luteolibacter flavescens]|uniref:Uncharacterized protein n=1 Tax=Luteolibacter flavescens TaxID=1859460 RepID=A0ABT3FVW4_9BACT|nr:hypothetical protein [Luteolibacter flavescens]MCW1887459.1 hypothetical protein [Luteolibacter flavescens]